MTWSPQKPPYSDFKNKVFLNASKVSNFIYQIGEYEELRKPSREVKIEDIKSKDFKEKLNYLKRCLLKYRKITGYGRGITAVQLGIPERFSVVYGEKEMTVIINPKVTKKSKTQLLYPEICMSANPIIVPTIRPSWIEFEYLDENGKHQYWKTKDDTKQGKIMNRVFQHEIDHMDGIINIDRVKIRESLILESDPKFYDNAEFELVK